MYAEERQRHILERARRDGRVDVAGLAAAFDVTYETVRRDLTALERHGVLRRVHGGAIPVERLGFEPTLAQRDTVMTPEKERIAKRALEEVPAEGAILLDAGSTTGRLAEQLPPDLTVVTNSVSIALTLMPRPNTNLMLLGGRLRPRTHATVESWALQALEETYVDVAFMATNGVSAEHGLTTPDPAEAQVKRAMIRSARRVVLLADHTKVGNDHFARFSTLDEVDCIITDSGLADGLADELAAFGPRVVVV
ncbi:DeoR/GlpR family DNA-binding transcription regulator [Streptomonospora nanhaiensis]|uniref:Lactose phosphotransferase system repressor n=1 Tax=Streptomonospora nanhaiensis TaxID=1323731 RepID=A0A853BS67_9ACTN|nr:DeoR/GlpR family DNA-binding transcription regulator [Streptomonospora nanhaiensis]MBV2366914.1 DeoR/GlpR family DNA-binding transcription regulator [Streptomonospora nanhaiensis]MBX9390542.1 DeoR/GlpR family DNA-binding transcription regulator [Streptomonospora nanhaiensis]NYI98609.1 DeoR family fructose operon transcriptional repressor [Streptomonospora nanhaiensis]